MKKNKIKLLSKIYKNKIFYNSQATIFVFILKGIVSLQRNKK